MALGLKRKIRADALYRAVDCVSYTDEEGVPRAITTETVFARQASLVQKFTRYFAAEGDPADAAAVRAALIDPVQEEAMHGSRRERDPRIHIMETHLP